MPHDLSKEQMFQAMETCDASLDGVFYVGVITTKIYCLPSCKARLPFRKNVIFLDTEAQAIAANLRACKRCKPDLFPHTEPAWVQVCQDKLKSIPERRISEAELATLAGVEISTLRRVFKSSTGNTPTQFHREIRLLHAANMLTAKTPILEVSEGSGFESLSGFSHAFRKRFGVSPGSYQTG